MNLGSESEYVEFKESLSQLDKGLKSLTAMLNKNHEARVYFGVDDEGNVVGLSIGKDTGTKIRTRIKELVAPEIVYRIDFLLDESGKDYVLLSASGGDAPYSCDGRYYIRNHASDDSVSNYLLRRMLLDGDTDLLRERESPNQNLTFTGLKGYLSSVGIHCYDTVEFYKSLKLYNGKGAFNMNGLLLSDQNEFYVKVVTFAGNDKSKMEEKIEFGGKCLLEVAADMISYFRVYDKIKVDLSGGIRKEIPLFDFESFREALINALVHNCWAEGLPPSVYIYDDSMEILSYGKIPYSLSLDEFYAGRSVPVNKSLFSVFKQSLLSEQSGHGVRIITSFYGKGVFRMGEAGVEVRIPFAYIRDDVLARRVLEVDPKSKKKKMLEILEETPSITTKELASSLSMSQSGAKKLLQRLMDDGLLKREGNRRSGRYVVLKP